MGRRVVNISTEDDVYLTFITCLLFHTLCQQCFDICFIFKLKYVCILYSFTNAVLDFFISCFFALFHALQ